ncbi:hypothetical protein HYH02_004597 [Chlamydomonas schloesseri]|uniref:N-acetyltransferase domain-containing protein n=1 Tax=Chlamydomonas schloesseri TaxID=2026947 RepID=A0A835WNI1_9CHLO|nr:hypothetical protein HYH02_004597 [Chlamydomonas schloesseri]|eukprot:KAG2450760.1 hypothetical protein HYH02_004597 [Chlamydomonas schloesseri]
MAYEREYNSDGEPIERSAPAKLSYRVEYIANNAIKLLDELLILEKATFRKGDSWADGDLADHLKKRNVVLAVARLEPDGKLCGYVLCTSTGLNIHVAKVAVREDCRRQGIARKMMEAILQAAAGVRRAMSSTLYVAVENTPAVELYKSLGFAEDGYLVSHGLPTCH